MNYHCLKERIRKHVTSSSYITALLAGKRPRGARKTKRSHNSKTEGNTYLSFPRISLPHFPSSKVLFLYHVTVACKRPIELVKLSFLGKKYCSNTPPCFGYNTRSHAPTPGKKKGQSRNLIAFQGKQVTLKLLLISA